MNRVNISKKTTLGVFLAVIVVLASVIWFFQAQVNDLQNKNSVLQNLNAELQNQNSFLQNQTSELKNQTSALQTQISELQNQLNSYGIPFVEITSFEWISGFDPYVGLTLRNRVNIIIQNEGDKDINGLALTVKLMYNGTQPYGTWGFTEQIQTLHSGESREISNWVYHSLSDPRNMMCVGTLMKGDVVLDERQILISY